MNLFKSITVVVIVNLIFEFTVQAAAISDPIADYLERSKEVLLGRFERRYYLGDNVYRFDIDLNNDGKKEVLVSSSLDRDGKQGNLFYVYKQGGDGLEHVGQMHLYPNGFYLGPIDEINAYGIVKFWPSGGGEGGYGAYIFDGNKIIEKPLGIIDRNHTTAELEGKGIEIAAKYSISVSDSILDDVQRLRKERGYKAPDPSSFVSEAQIITSKELADKYGVKVEPKTYQQALQEGSLESTPIKVTPTPTSTATPTSAAVQNSTPVVDKQSSSSFPIIPVAIIAAVIVVAAALLLRRKSS